MARLLKGNLSHALVVCSACAGRTAADRRTAGRIRCADCGATVRVRKGGPEAGKNALNERAAGARDKSVKKDASGLTRRPIDAGRPDQPGPPRNRKPKITPGGPS